jgi:hypothetical protein
VWVTIGEKDTAESLGFSHGLIWETVWAAPENKTLRESRSDALVLNPGDRLFIPAAREKWLGAPTNQRTVFRRRGVPSKIRIQLQVNGVPEDGVPYVLEIDRQRIEGTVPADGVIEHWVRPDQDDAVLWAGRGSTRRRYALKLRELRPADTIAGVQNRLCNRGYPVTVTGELDDETRDRLRRFQEDNGLSVTGEPDAATQEALKKAHGV